MSHSSSMQRIVSDWSSSRRMEPVAIIFVKCAEEVNRMAAFCRKLLQQSTMNNVNVLCLNSSFEVNVLMKGNNIDILVMPVFCYQSFANHEQMSLLFKTQRLRYVWFNQIDEMCSINQSKTVETLNVFLAQNLQVKAVYFKSFVVFCFFIEKIFITIPLFRSWSLQRHTVPFFMNFDCSRISRHSQCF